MHVVQCVWLLATVYIVRLVDAQSSTVGIAVNWGTINISNALNNVTIMNSTGGCGIVLPRDVPIRPTITLTNAGEWRRVDTQAPTQEPRPRISRIRTTVTVRLC
jgi:hypothetical protein